MRILDSKDEGDQVLVAKAPRMEDFLNKESSALFDAVLSGLDALGVRYRKNPHLVRGLDYYSHTAFEFVTRELGAQGAVIAGGRYDGLMETMGGPPTPAVGWAGGIERAGHACGRRTRCSPTHRAGARRRRCSGCRHAIGP